MLRILPLILLLPSLASAATWYVRPATGEYGAEDGTTYTTAFDGDTDAWAVAGDIDSGDTVYYCGTFREVVTVQDTGVTIRLDCPDDPAILDGADVYDETGWTLTGGEYCRAMSASNGAVSGKLGPSIIKNGTHLTPGLAGSLVSGEWGCGNTTGFPNTTCNSGAYTVCVKDEPVAGDEFEIPIRIRLIAFNPGNDAGLDNGTFSVIGGGGSILRNSAENGIAVYSDAHQRDYASITVQNVACDWMGSQCVHVYGTATGDATTIGTVSLTDVSCTNNGGECNYIRDFVQTTITVNGTTCTGSGNGWQGTLSAGSFAGDCVDIQNTTGTYSPTSTIYNVECSDSNGSGIAFGGGGPAQIYSNDISDCDQAAVEASLNAGILVDSQQAGNVFVWGNYLHYTTGNPMSIRGSATTNPVFWIYGNRLTHTDNAAGDCIIKNSTHYDGIHIDNNTFDGCYRALYVSTTPETPTNSSFNNNICTGTEYCWWIQKATITGITAATNLVYNAGSTPYCTGVTPTCSDTPQAQFTGTVTGNPLLTATHRLGIGSAARETGTNIGPRQDYGNRRFRYPPSIGAWEAASGDIATARTAATRSVATRSAASARTAR